MSELLQLADNLGIRATSSSFSNSLLILSPPSSRSAINNYPSLSIVAAMSGQRIRSKLRKAGRSTGKCLKTAAWQTCKCALWTCCAPCICLAMCCIPGRCRHRLQRRGCVQNCKPFDFAMPAMPYPRERALTIPSDDWQDDQLILEQPQSVFMTKLPLEIRRMVYEHALGKRSIHASTIGGTLVGVACRIEDCRCGNHESDQETKLSFALPLLRTCRLM